MVTKPCGSELPDVVSISRNNDLFITPEQGLPMGLNTMQIDISGGENRSLRVVTNPAGRPQICKPSTSTISASAASRSARKRRPEAGSFQAAESASRGESSGASAKAMARRITERAGRGTALANEQTGLVIYTPPVGEDVLRSKLANWERYLHEARDIDPLIRMAVGHYQFEAIHPFADGNGRTGRVLNSLFLIQEDLLGLPILYLSRYIIANKADYYRLLLDVTREGAWQPWLLYMLRGIEETAQWTIAKIAAMRELSTLTIAHIRHAAPKSYSRELVELIFELPYCRIQNLVSQGLAGRQAAARHLRQLVEIGVLQELPAGREKLFIHPKLMQLLTRDDNTLTPYF